MIIFALEVFPYTVNFKFMLIDALELYVPK